jgi:hypothetical protein
MDEKCVGVVRLVDNAYSGNQTLGVMAGLVPAIHDFNFAELLRRGCPAQGRA